MDETLVIIGAGGHGKVVADIAIMLKNWQRVVFLDDNDAIKEVMGLKVIGKVNDAVLYVEKYFYFVAIGDNQVRENLQRKLIEKGASFVKLIHPNASISPNTSIGVGTVVMAGVVINNSTKIGNGCIINTSSIVEHDNVIKDFVHVSPGVAIAGGVEVGEKCWLGIGSIVNNNIKICGDSVIGAGAVVVKNIDEAGTYIGIPVRRT